MSVPCFHTSGSGPIAPGHRAYTGLPTAIDRTNASDPQLVREAIRARSIARQEGPVWDAYAGCDRAPMNWERGV